MNFQVQRKQMITLALSLLLAIWSYWIPLPLSTKTSAQMQNLELISKGKVASY